MSLYLNLLKHISEAYTRQLCDEAKHAKPHLPLWEYAVSRGSKFNDHRLKSKVKAVTIYTYRMHQGQTYERPLLRDKRYIYIASDHWSSQWHRRKFQLQNSIACKTVRMNL